MRNIILLCILAMLLNNLLRSTPLSIQRGIKSSTPFFLSGHEHERYKELEKKNVAREAIS